MADKLRARRGAPRVSTKFTAQVTTRTGASRGTVKDLSAAGICFRLMLDIEATAGRHVTIESSEFGLLTGRVQWTRGDLIGIRFDESTKASAQISSYFKYFRPAPVRTSPVGMHSRI